MRDASLRQSMSMLHRWGGLVAGWIGFAIFLTGTLAVFDDEITRWSSPETTVSAPAAPHAAVAIMTALDRRSPAYWFASMPSDRTPAMRVMSKDAAGTLEREQIDPASGRAIEARSTGGGGFFTRFHYTLHAGDIGTWIVAAVSVAMLVAMISGVIVHRRIFSDFFTFRPRAAAQRRWLDLHNLLAVLTLPFLLMIVYTGLTIKSRTYLPVPPGPHPTARAAPLAEPPPAPARPLTIAALFARAEAVLGRGRIAFVTVREDDGTALFVASRAIDDRLNLSTDTATFDRASGASLGTTQVDRPAYLTQRVFAGLHFGQYGGLAVRWLYFALGIGGTVMIGSGLILFGIKRPNRWLGAVTVAAVAGIVVACLAHLAAARWLPFDLPHRETREATIFFTIWGIAAVHALARPWSSALREQAAFIAIMAGALACADLAAAAANRSSIDTASLTVDFVLVIVTIVFAAIAHRFDAMITDRRSSLRDLPLTVAA